MSQAISKLMDRWTNDAAFRRQLRADPEGTLQRSGVQLSADELAAFRSVDWNQSDEQLSSRTNKANL